MSDYRVWCPANDEHREEGVLIRKVSSIDDAVEEYVRDALAGGDWHDEELMVAGEMSGPEVRVRVEVDYRPTVIVREQFDDDAA